jgi:cytoskeletal protein RodZ
MPIGEFLAAARHRAGLSVAQVSEQTRIRETIISGIESGDYSACGGDFYARGHIRAIAKAVGADAEPLIQEYDSRHRAPGAVSAVSLEELLSTSAQVPLRRRVNWKPVLVLALVVVAGFGVYRLVSGVPQQAVARPPVAEAGQVQQHTRPDPGFPAGQAASGAVRSRPRAHSRDTLRRSVLVVATPVSSQNDLRSPRGRHAHRPGTQRPDRQTRPRHGHPHRHGHHGHGHRGHGHHGRGHHGHGHHGRA